MAERLILVRLSGEISTKSNRVRRRFTEHLVDNMHDALRSVGVQQRIRNEWSRIFVEVDSVEPALDVLTRVFGIASCSPIDRVTKPVLDEIVRVGEETYRDIVNGRRYAVRARRSGRHPFSAQDVNVKLGAALNPYGTVDLEQPDVTVHVEVRPQAAYLFHRIVPGPGGLPLGVEGRAVSLISGGFDSAVASWLMLKRGVELEYVFCNLAGAAYERSVLLVARLLATAWSYGSHPRIHVLDFEPLVKELRDKVKPQYLQVVLKRLMYRAACRIAEHTGAHAVITGESVGQVSSQTLANLRSIDVVADYPVLRPVIAYNKDEIVRQAQWVGTYALSAVVQEYCALVPRHPVTAATPHGVDVAEQDVDLSLLDAAVRDRKVLFLRELSDADLVVPYLFTEEIPEDATVIDCRPQSQFEAWHYPGALHKDVDDLLVNYKQLPKDRTYVLYCMWGLQSAAVAEKMQRDGYQAYSFKGGVPALMRRVGADEKAPVDDRTP